MKTDVLLYEAGIIALICAVAAMAVVLKKLTGIVGKKQTIWVLPVVAGVFLAAAICAHAYASFVLIPQLSSLMNGFAAASADRLGALKDSVQAMKSQVVFLKAFSFSCFFLASALLAAATGIYMRWISK